MPNDFISNSNVISTPGNLAVGGVAYIGTLTEQMNLAAAQALATGTAVILIPAGFSMIRVSAAASTTGATLPLGTFNGQMLTILVTSAIANTITFAAAGTSFVAGGASVSLAGLAAHDFRWDIIGQLWYQVGPATN